MAESDFGLFGDSAGDVARGVTAGFTPPNGGGNFVLGFNSRVDGVKTVGLFYNATNFAPLRDDLGNATGGSVRACLKRSRQSLNPIGFSVGLFVNLVNTTSSDKAYILGLSDGDPSTIMLAKMSLGSGLDPASTNMIMISSETFLWDVWLQLRLDAIVNPNGDVVLKCFRNDLVVNPCTAPVWAAIPGMPDFIDDALGIATSSEPLGGGYGGFYFTSAKAGLRAFVDQFEMYRQM